MKNILFGLLAIGSISAFAGTMGLPSQDPVVKTLRFKFGKSKQPNIEQLKIGKIWDCKEFVARQDNFTVNDMKDAFKLDQYDGLIENTGTARVNNLVFDGSSLVGLRTSDHGLVFIKVSPDGDLLIENTWVRDQETNDDNFISAVSDKNLLVYSYLVCPVSKTH